MRVLVFKVALAAAVLALLNSHSIAASNCEITKCRSGGKINTCWASMKQEASSKAKSCNHIIIGSGSSAYAMALSLPRACIKPNAIIKIHRPYHPNYKAVPVGSHWHTYYFGRIKPTAVNYFKSRGGMARDGWSNAMGMISVPAAETGLPICKAL